MKTIINCGVFVAAFSLIGTAAFAQTTVIRDPNTQTTVTTPSNGKTEVRTLPNGDTVITVNVNDQPVAFDETSRPRMIGGRVMVPLRGVIEKLGGTVLYDEKTQVITGAHDGTSNQFRLRVGSNEALVNGKQMELATPPRVIDGVTYVPLRFVSEAMGAQVDWNEEKHTVTIEAGGNVAEVKTGH